MRNGEPIPIDELVRDRDALAAQLLRSGGLLNYAKSLKPIVASRA